MNKDTIYMLDTLTRAGITLDDAMALRRISMTLHRWHELECGDDSGCIERDETTDKPFMVRYPSLKAYIQGDPRGAALYILRPDDVPEGKDVDAYYSRGLAVYK